MSARTTPATSERAEFAGPAGRRGRRRRVTVTVAAVVVVLAAGAAVWLAGGFGARGPSGSGNAASLSGTTTQTVKRETLSAQTTLSATLGYAGSYPVSVPSSGSSGSPARFTWLPRAGRVIRQGQVLYRTDNGVPAYLLYGRVPAWRELAPVGEKRPARKVVGPAQNAIEPLGPSADSS